MVAVIAEFSKFYYMSIDKILKMPWKQFVGFLNYKNDCIEKENERTREHQRQTDKMRRRRGVI